MSGVEILGIAAGVVQIAELGGKLSVKLFTFTRKIKNADKNIDSISQDIAATGAVLQQLGNELKKDEKLRLCSPEAIATAKSLMEECHKIFKELNDAVDGKGKALGSGAKVVLGLKQRLKYPFLEPQIELLKANLEKLKSSLLVMLNVLIFAEQLKNQEALPILKDQRELLKTLVEEKVASQKQYDQVLKRLDQLTVGKEDTSLSSLSREITSTTNSSITLVDQGRFTETLPGTSQDDFLPSLPAHLQHRAEELIDHCRLIKTVIGEVNHAQYKIDLGIRYRTQELVLGSHYSEWAHQLGSHVNNTYQMKSQDRFDFLETCPELKRHWLQRHFDTAKPEEQALTASRPQRQQQQGIYAQDLRARQQQMMQHRMSQPMEQQQGNYALQDYQMQMTLIEQQNKKRLMMARQEQDDAINASNQNQPHDAEQEQAAHNSLTKAPIESPYSAEQIALVDVERQCGVSLTTGKPCARSLTCKSHSMAAKRAVPGRSMPYDMLLAEYRKKNEARQQKATVEVNAPVSEVNPADTRPMVMYQTSQGSKDGTISLDPANFLASSNAEDLLLDSPEAEFNMDFSSIDQSDALDHFDFDTFLQSGSQADFNFNESPLDVHGAPSEPPQSAKYRNSRSRSPPPRRDGYSIGYRGRGRYVDPPRRRSRTPALYHRRSRPYSRSRSRSPPRRSRRSPSYSSYESRSRSRRLSPNRSQTPSRSLSRDLTASQPLVDDQKQSMAIVEPSASTTSRKRFAPWTSSDSGGERYAYATKPIDVRRIRRRLPAQQPALTPSQQEMALPSAPTKVPEDIASLKIDSEKTYLSRSLAGGKPQPTYPTEPEAPLQPDTITRRKRGRPTKAESDRGTLPRNGAGGVAAGTYRVSKSLRPNGGFTLYGDSQLPSGVASAKGSTLKRGVDKRASAWPPSGTSAIEPQDAAQIEVEQAGDGESFMDLIARYTLLDERDLMRAGS